jgi:predicted GIY-YIG superfamily endonuclease
MNAALYRFFDTDGRLLYVGVAMDPDRREIGHRSNSPWHHLATQRTDEWLSSRPEAVAAEKRAIQSEHPAFNRRDYVRHAPTMRPVTTLLGRQELAKIDELAAEEERDRSSMIRLLLREALAARERKGGHR